MGEVERGSGRLLAAWQARQVTDDMVTEFAKFLDGSPAEVLQVAVGAGEGEGVGVTVRYADDDVPQCGNDIAWILGFLRKHGVVYRPPRIIINGIPWPDEVLISVQLGAIDESNSPQLGGIASGIGAEIGIR